MFIKSILNIDPFDSMSDEDIKTAIRNSNGLKPSLFVPEGAFVILVKQQIARLQEPSLQCVHLIYDELRRIVFSVDIPELKRF